MKKLYSFLIAFLLCSLFVNAQGIYQMWGMTQKGGPDNNGVIFSSDTLGNNFQLRHSFDVTNAGASPMFTELIDYNGKFYGMTWRGGDNNLGVIFEWDPASNIYSKKFSFDSSNGIYPEGSLALYGGKFYGMTSFGGSDYRGVIFEWNPVTNIFIKKIDLDSSNGHIPHGSLTLNGGKFYGMTQVGGSDNLGVIFEWDPVTNIYSKKIDFKFTNGNGYYPFSDLVLRGGKFYGVTLKGGSNDRGVIFEWDPSTNLYIKKIDFNGVNGHGPLGNLTWNGSKFYGMTIIGGSNNDGVIFEWDPVTNVYLKKVDMISTTGSNPQNSLTFSGGKFYGMATAGGSKDSGAIFQWDPVTNIYTKKVDFNMIKGGQPLGNLTFKGGKFYGMTSRGGGGGSNGYFDGVIFEWDPVTNVYTKKINFNSTNGFSPAGNLINRNGKFYGMTPLGGIDNKGVIFEWNPANNQYRNLNDIVPANGGECYGSLALNSDKFYGMTSIGGNTNKGVIFELDPATNVYTKKFDFNASMGTTPYGNLTINGGKFYGMTTSGGNNTLGVIFEWDPSTNIYTKKIDLNGIIGSSPYSSLTFNAGKFYGMTTKGGDNDLGVIFEWDPITNVYTKKINLSTFSGSNPFGNLTLFGGKFYGMTFKGGINNLGVIFEWNPVTNVYVKKIDFSTTNGSSPFSTLNLSGGKFYGMTRLGGINNLGVFFEWDPLTNVYTIKKNFTGINGANPSYGNDLTRLPAPVASGVANTCTSFPSITIDNTNNNIWVAITDALGDAIGEIKANGNNLGIVNTSMYINNGPVREDGNNRLYLDRNISITPLVQPSTPVDIRLYLKGSEFEALKNATNSLGQPSGINTINDVSFFKNNGACSATVQNSANPVLVTAAAWNGDYVLTASISAFSSFYLANKTYAVLPLNLSEFNARLFNTNGELSWKTENEINTLSFDIERSTDGISFISTGNIIAANTSGVHFYNYTDKKITSLGVPLLYYRLKQKDNDGRFTYSRIISLVIDAGKETVTIYPNPVTNEVAFIISINQAEKIEGRITDNSGRVVKGQQWNLQAGSSTLSLDITGLAKGIYTLEIKGERTHERQQFVKQ
jgi:uncharacterized repeat protein (TIGR03803 family)